MDTESKENKADARIETGRFVVSGEDVDGCLAHDAGPGHPLRFIFRVGGEQEADETEDGREDPRGPFAGCAPGEVGGVLGEIREEGAEEELHSKGGWFASASNTKYRIR